MSEHKATIAWKRKSKDFTFDSYNRDHEWRFNDTVEVPASSAPQFQGTPERVDPEQTFVAAVSACHMLTFLSLAAKQRFVVDEYTDEPTGYLEKNEENKLAMVRVELRPKVHFGPDGSPSGEQLAKLHDQAHRYCFIANSVKTQITIA